MRIPDGPGAIKRAPTDDFMLKLLRQQTEDLKDRGRGRQATHVQVIPMLSLLVHLKCIRRERGLAKMPVASTSFVNCESRRRVVGRAVSFMRFEVSPVRLLESHSGNQILYHDSCGSEY
jgi:hypothetical protein